MQKRATVTHWEKIVERDTGFIYAAWWCVSMVVQTLHVLAKCEKKVTSVKGGTQSFCDVITQHKSNFLRLKC